MVLKEFTDLDVLFLVPPVFRIMGKKWDSYPLGLGYLVSSLDQYNVKSAIYHANYLAVDECPPDENWSLYLAKRWEIFYTVTKDPDNKIWKELVHVLKTTNPKVVGISSCIVDLPSTTRVISIIKEFNPDIKVIVGGASATTYSDKLMKNPLIDVLVIGEGERTIQELIPHLLDEPLDWTKLADIPGLKYRANDKIVQTNQRELINDLDEIPFPNREKIFIVTDSGELKKIYLAGEILFSRGCFFKCKFCSAYTVWGTRKPRSRSAENIIQELTELKTKYNQKLFIFWDDLFTVNRSRVVKLCNDLIQKELNINWVCLARIDTVDKELLELMKLAGCIEVQFGVESGSDRILTLTKKGITVKQIIDTGRLLRKSGLSWSIFLIIGFPSETVEEMLTTINFINILKPSRVDLSIFAPYPGTEFYTELSESGHITDTTEQSDTSKFDKNYTLIVPEDQFKRIAEESFETIRIYNNRSNYFSHRIRVWVELIRWYILKAVNRLNKVEG